MADILSTLLERVAKPLGSNAFGGQPLDELVTELISNRGEVRGMALAREILDGYDQMDRDHKHWFFTLLATGMDIDANSVREALEAYEKKPSRSTYRKFVEAAEPARLELIRRLNQVPGATASLVNMRKDLLTMTREDPMLAALDLDFRHLLASWFNRGFLVLRPISWKSPAHILEKIIAYEAVHTIHNWDDLRLRLQPVDRRCFAFFHPSIPDEPLIFVEVALTRGIPGSIQGVLTNERENIDATEADTAVFYSISNCQAGLAGISFGNFLIKQVVEDLSHELPNLKKFVTLSPIPGLVKWLEAEGRNDKIDPENPKAEAALYLLNAKRPDGLPLDPVARFHLGNGARIHAIHAKADLSDNGLVQSHGAMVNYLYDIAKIPQNHELFASQQGVAASQEVKKLARSAASTIV